MLFPLSEITLSCGSHARFPCICEVFINTSLSLLTLGNYSTLPLRYALFSPMIFMFGSLNLCVIKTAPSFLVLFIIYFSACLFWEVGALSIFVILVPKVGVMRLFFFFLGQSNVLRFRLNFFPCGLAH